MIYSYDWIEYDILKIFFFYNYVFTMSIIFVIYKYILTREGILNVIQSLT